MNSPHGIWRATQGKPVTKYYISTLLNIDHSCVSLILYKESFVLRELSVFCLRSMTWITAPKPLGFRQKHCSLWYFALHYIALYIIKQVVCTLVCQLYGIVTEHKRHKIIKSLCRLWMSPGESYVASNLQKWTYAHLKRTVAALSDRVEFLL